MLSFKCDEIILSGDFNLVLDILKDKKGGKQTTHWNSLKELIKSIQNNLDLTDIWRDLRTLLCKNQTKWEMKIFDLHSNLACR